MTANKPYNKEEKKESHKPIIIYKFFPIILPISTGIFIQSFRLKLVWLDATVHGMRKYVASLVLDIGHTTAFLKRRRRTQ